MTAPSATTLAALRRLLLAVLAFGIAGTVIDLLLLAHYEDGWQLIPFAVLALACVTAGAVAFTNPGTSRAVTALLLFRTVMVLLILAGVAGAVLHYRANMEFKLEMDPSMSGRTLFWSVVRAKAPPAMAPASLVLMGLLGLATTYRGLLYARLETDQHQQE